MRKVCVRSDRQAVSPVIATILLVAITVVLAAVLYVMVTGIFGPGGGSTPPPTVQLVAQAEGQGVYAVRVFSNRADGLGAFRVSLMNETTGVACVTEEELTAAFNATCSPGVVVSFQDLASPGQSQFNEGDAFRITGVRDPNRYTLNLVWKTSGGIIAHGSIPA